MNDEAVEEHPDGGGVCYFSGLTPIQQAFVSVAGNCATRPDRGMADFHCSDDRRRLIEDLRAAGIRGTDDQCLDFGFSLEETVHGILAEHYRFPKACAAALYEKSRLSPDEIDELWELYR